MKLALINLPAPFLENPKWVYPTGILSVAAWAKKLGHEVEIVDLADASLKDFDEGIEKIEADAIGVSAVTPQAWYLSEIPVKRPEVHLIAGGIHASLFPGEVILMGYDVVVKGEAEPVLEEALSSSLSGEVISAPVRVELDEFPRIDRSMVSGYKGPVPVMAGRGCPFTCAFCAQTDRQVRLREPKSVVEELVHIPEQDIIFYDDTFTIRDSWLKDFQLWAEYFGINKRMRCSTRSDKCTAQTIALLKSCGFVEVCLGVESGDQGILDGIGKRTKVQTNTDAVKICRKAGIRSKAFIMLGLPGESEDSIKRTHEWISKARPDKIGLYLFNPLPGSDIYDHPEKYDLQFVRGRWSTRFYGGARETMKAKVSTSKISADRITDWYQIFLQDFSALL